MSLVCLSLPPDSSRSSVQKHTPRVPSVHLLGCTCVPHSAQPPGFCPLRSAEVAEQQRAASWWQAPGFGHSGPAGTEEPHCLHGGGGSSRTLPAEPEDPPVYGPVCGWPGQLFRWSRPLLPRLDHGGSDEEADQIHGSRADSPHHGKTVSLSVNYRHLHSCQRANLNRTLSVTR